MYKKQASVTLLPVLPLRDVVVYPNMVIPLFVGRERSMKALELAMEGPDKQIVLLAQRSPDIDDPQAEDLYDIGTVATVIQLLKLPDGTIKVLVEGIQRIKASDIVLKDDTLMANASEIEIVAVKDAREAEVAQRSLLSLFEQYVKSNRKLPPELLATLAGIDDPSRFADTVAAHLSVRLADKQRLLETAAPEARLEMLIGLVEGEIDVQHIEKRIRSRVKTQMEKRSASSEQ